MIEPNTGLPEVPALFFWRVINDRFFGYFYIQLRRRTWWWGLSRKVADFKIMDNKWLLTTNDIRYSAEIIMRMDVTQVAFGNKITRKASNKAFLGDYPPKKLS